MEERHNVFPETGGGNTIGGRSSATVSGRRRRNGFLGGLAVAGSLAFKFKSVLLVALTKVKPLLAGIKFLKLGPLLKTGLSMLIAMWFYALAWGWAFGAGFVLLVFVHEMGHALALSRFGVRTSVPVFIPFVGAFIGMKELPANVRVEAWSALAGPLLGTAGAVCCWLIAALTGEPFWQALAYTGFFLNLFNLLPVTPLDGGRAVAAVSPRLWIFGFGGLLLLFFWSFNPLLLLILFLSGNRTWAAVRGRETLPEGYYDVPPITRFSVSVVYFGLLLFLAAAMFLTHFEP